MEAEQARHIFSHFVHWRSFLIFSVPCARQTPRLHIIFLQRCCKAMDVVPRSGFEKSERAVGSCVLNAVYMNDYPGSVSQILALKSLFLHPTVAIGFDQKN